VQYARSVPCQDFVTDGEFEIGGEFETAVSFWFNGFHVLLSNPLTISLQFSYWISLDNDDDWWRLVGGGDRYVSVYRYIV
jgi:hypothetical protein